MKQIIFSLLIVSCWQLMAQGPYTPPYTTDFNSYSTESEFLADWSYENNLPTDQAGVWGFDYTAYFGYNSSNCPFYFTASDATGDDWLFSPGFTLVQGTTYTVTFLYAGAYEGYTEKMKLYVGDSDTSAAMTQLLNDFTDISSATFQSFSASFSIPSTGVYHLGFLSQSDAGNFGILIDNFSIDNGTGFDNQVLPESSFYPNPCSGILNISSAEALDVVVYATTGNMVLHTLANGTVDLTALDEGLYFLQINHKKTQPLIIQK